MEWCIQCGFREMELMVYDVLSGYESVRLVLKMRSDEDVVSGGVGHVEYLEEGRTDDHEEEDA